MAMGLTEQQISEVKQALSEMGHDEQEVEEALHLLHKNNIDTSPTEGGDVSRLKVKMAINDETDWKKKAALAALMISQDI